MCKVYVLHHIKGFIYVKDISIIISTMTTIAIREETKKRLDAVGNKGDTYEDVIVKLLDCCEEKINV